MSMKRSRQNDYRPAERDSGGPRPSLSSKKTPAPEKGWAEQIEGKPDDVFVPYAMTSRFEKGTLIRHATFGKGIVVAASGPHLDVLFELGSKRLRHAG